MSGIGQEIIPFACWDSLNKKSYPTVSGSFYNLIDGATLDSSAADYATLNNIDVITVSVVVKKIGELFGYAIHPAYKWNMGTQNASFVLYHFGTFSGSFTVDGAYGWYGSTSNGGWQGITGGLSTPQPIGSTWHFVLQYNSITGGQMWVNGQKKDARGSSGFLGPTNTYTTTNGVGGSARPDYDEGREVLRTKYIAIYDKELNDEQIRALYKQLKPRFGIT